jgi:hypothetical protein
MNALVLKLDGDGAWPDLAGKIDTPQVIHLGNDAKPIEISVLDAGMHSGRPSIMIRLELPDGRTVLAETSARLFCSAGRAVLAKYPRLFDDN